MATRTRTTNAPVSVVSNEVPTVEMEPVTITVTEPNMTGGHDKRTQFEGDTDDDAPVGHIDAPEVTTDTPDADLPPRIGLIYTSKATVKANNKTLARMYAELGERVLSQTASTIFHAAKHGDAVLLNNFYNIVPASQQQSFKEWLVNYMKTDYPENTKVSNYWLGQSKEKGFFVRQGCQADRNKFIARCTDDSLNAVHRFNWTKQRAESIKNPFDDADLAASLARILKRATADDAEVSATQLEALKHAIKAFEKEATVGFEEAEKRLKARRAA